MSGSLASCALCRRLGITLPVIGGAMYPCSNPELVAAVSAAGGIGIVQPLSLTYVHGYDFRDGLRYIRSITDRPIGMNALIEQSSRRYRRRMSAWLDIALEEGVRFIVTSLGKPDWVVARVHAAGGLVYHDATTRHWAEKGIEAGVDGLIAVNNRAGGHAGALDPAALYRQLHDLDVPLICAGGIGDERAFIDALHIGYAGVQIGTRLIASDECHAQASYKQAIVEATDTDIVHTERLTGVPVAVIRTSYIEHTGLKAGPIVRRLLAHPRGKRLMRTLLGLRSLQRLKHTELRGHRHNDYWQAGRSVAGIHDIEPVAVFMQRFAAAWLHVNGERNPAAITPNGG